MKLLVVQTIEVDGVVKESKTIKVSKDPGGAYSIGHGVIVSCHDGILLNYRGKKEMLIQVTETGYEPMVRLNGSGLVQPIKQQFKRDHVLELVIPRRERLTVVRQVITRIN